MVDTTEIESYCKRLREYLDSRGDNIDEVDIKFNEILKLIEDIFDITDQKL